MTAIPAVGPVAAVATAVSAAEIAIVHDYFTQRGGAERVAERLAALFPAGAVFASVASAAARPPALAARPVRVSRLQALFDAGLPLGALAPLLPRAMATLPIAPGTRVVLSSSSAFAQHVRVPAGAVHVAYCHTPPRFLWEPDEYFGGRRVTRALLSPALSVARGADARAAGRVDLFLANSAFTAERIRRFYGREARVLPPPIETDAFAPTPERSGRFLVASRLKRHKRIDLAIDAANRTGFGLDVIGEGPEERRLRAAAGPTVRFLGRLPDADVRAAMARTAGLLVPGVEDFGMTMAEVQAAGRPPIAFARGGALEIVADRATGFLVADQTADAFADAMARAMATPLDSPSEAAAIRASARRFDAAGFDAAIREIVAGAARR